MQRFLGRLFGPLLAMLRGQPDPAPAASFEAMDADRFWSIVNETVPYKAEKTAQIDALRQSLSQLSVGEIESFAARFDALMAESYSWDLWGAVFVANGGASDDAFDYFRAWLIAQGRAMYGTVCADSDALADLLPDDIGEGLEFEEFAYVAMDVWGAKTGRKGQDMPGASFSANEPSGEPFEEDDAHLAARYPKLWQRFGNSS